MENGKLILVTGDKGGGGKSFVSAVVSDSLYRLHSDLDLLIVEGDGVVGDVAARFEDSGIPGVLAAMDGDPTSAVAALVDHLDKDRADRVIVNLPAAACLTIDPLAGSLVAPAAEALDLEIVCLFVLTAEPASARLAGRSLRSGLAAIADRKIAVLNGHFGHAESFAWSESGERAAWLAAGGVEAWLPDLHQRVARIVRERPFSHYLPGGAAAAELTLSGRILLQRWLAQADGIMDLIEGGNEEREVAA